MSSRTVLAGSMVALGWLFLRALCCPAGCASASLHTVIYPLPAHPLRLHFRKLQTCTKKPGGRGFLSFIFRTHPALGGKFRGAVLHSMAEP